MDQKRKIRSSLNALRGALAASRITAKSLVALAVIGTATTAHAATLTVDCAGNTAADTAAFEALPGCGMVGDCVPADNILLANPPCTPDFGTRKFQNDGKISVPNGATLTLNAGEIVVNKKIAGKHTKVAPDDNGANVSLVATGNITINKKINVSGRETAGSISIDAGGDVNINHQLIARGQGGAAPTATGGTITVHADGTVNSKKRGKIVVRGKKKVTQAGVADISGDLGVDLKGRIEARGLYGGSVAATTSSGNINLEEEIRAYGEFGSGGNVTLSAPAGTITIGGKKGAIRAHGGTPTGGGTVMLIADGKIDMLKTINVKGIMAQPGGIVDLSSDNGDVSVKTILAFGNPGGNVDLSSQTANVNITHKIDASSNQGDGGHVGAVATSGDLTVTGSVYANSAKQAGNGGEIILWAGGNTTLGTPKHSKFLANGAVDGGLIHGRASFGDVAVNGEFDATGGTNDGCILFEDFDMTPTVDPEASTDPAFQTMMCP